MFEVKRLLKVPKDKELRRVLRSEVGLFVSEHKILPPSDFKTLEYNANSLLTKLGIDEELLDFTIVLFGNEIWRKTVAATPFNRRLLLLPQCLKNSTECQAEIDGLGLICAGCKSCQIDRILTVAEGLGYTTLVAEGTTVAIGLVEEGSIDAVIGVSCMSVLQRSFEPVSHVAVPAIGLPLLDDGCKNTHLDYNWLFEELHQFEQNNGMEPLSVSLLKNQVADYFSEARLKRFFLLENRTEITALKMMAMGGQRMRPLLSALAYQSYSLTISEPIQESLSVIIECFHKASLIHDDIEDDEDTRYGQPTLQKSEGVSVAINVGDYLIGKGYQLLANLQLNPEVITECLKVIASSHVRLSQGQGADILFYQNIAQQSVENVLRIFKHKTGEAVKVALLTGAIVGQAPQSELPVLRNFSDWFGIAYQIRDDLNEYREENKLEHAFDYPFLLALLNQEFKNTGYSLPEILQTNNVKILREYFLKFNIEEIAGQFLEQYTGKCYRELDKLQNQKLRLSLYGVMGNVFKK